MRTALNSLAKRDVEQGARGLFSNGPNWMFSISNSEMTGGNVGGSSQRVTVPWETTERELDNNTIERWKHSYSLRQVYFNLAKYLGDYISIRFNNEQERSITLVRLLSQHLNFLLHELLHIVADSQVSFTLQWEERREREKEKERRKEDRHRAFGHDNWRG